MAVLDFTNGTLTVDNQEQIWIQKGSYTSAPIPNSSYDDIVIEGATTCGLSMLSATAGVLGWGNSTNNLVGYIQYTHSNNTMVIGTNASEEFRIDANGCWIHKGQYGSTPSVSTSADDLVVEGDGSNSAGMSIIVDAGSYGSLFIATPSSANDGGIQYQDTLGYLWLISQGNVVVRANSTSFSSEGDNTMNLGTSDKRWVDVWAVDGTINTSDDREKIMEDNLLGLEFINALETKRYKWKIAKRNVTIDPKDHTEIVNSETPGNRYHYGLSAQQVKHTMDLFGIKSDDFAGWCLADKNDSNSRQSLRYGEFIAPTIRAIQEQQQIIQYLRGQVDDLKLVVNEQKLSIIKFRSDIEELNNKLDNL